MPENDETLEAKVARLSAENTKLKDEARLRELARNKVGLAFKQVPEAGDAELLAQGHFPILTRIDSLSCVKDTPQPPVTLIEGDNISALMALQNTHKGRVDVIYIDPPYNTGSDAFVYADKRTYKSSEEELEEDNYEKSLRGKRVGSEDPNRHSKWLSFMERRLWLAQELLSNTGVIFVSIDDNEQARLKLLMDRVFGEENFVANIIWRKKTGASDTVNLATVTEYILAYEKKTGCGSWNRNLDSHDLSRYKLVDEYESTRGKHYLDNLDRGGLRYSDSLNFSVEAPDGTLVFPNGRTEFTREGWTWKWGKEKVSWGLANGFLEFRRAAKKESGWALCYKNYLLVDNEGELRERSAPYKNMIMEPLNQAGAEEMKNILGNKAFSFPKPTELMKKVLQLAGPKDAVILDFFAGSGSTAHAVAEFNKEDGGTRKCILVTNNMDWGMDSKGGPVAVEHRIAETVTAERVKKVLTGENWADGKEHEPLPGNLHYYRLSLNESSRDRYALTESVGHRWEPIAALQTGSHIPALETDEYAVLTGGDKVAVVWGDAFSTSFLEERIPELQEEVDAVIPEGERGKPVVFYAPAVETTPELLEAVETAGWVYQQFPGDYLDTLATVRELMLGNGTLLLPEDAEEEAEPATPEIPGTIAPIAINVEENN